MILINSLSRFRRAVGQSHLEQEVRHSAFFIVIGTVLAVGALAGIALSVGTDRLSDVFARANWAWLPIALGATAASYVGYVVAYRETAGADGMPLSRIGALVTSGFGLFIPRGGFALDVEALAAAGVPEHKARIRVLALGTLEYAVLAPAVFVTAVLLLCRQWPVQLGVRLPWAIGVPLGGMIALWLLRHRSSLRRSGGWRSRLAQPLDGIAETVRLWRHPYVGLRAFLGMAVYWAADIFVLWACIAVFSGHQPSVETIIIGYATGYALTRRALPLAGAGAVESLLPFALSWTGIGLGVAVASVCAYRVFNLWLPLIPAAAGVPEHKARIRVLALGTLEYAVLAPAVFVTAVLLLCRQWPVQLGVRLPWAIGVPVGGMIALWLLRHRSSLRRSGGWRSRLAQPLDGIAETLRLWRHPYIGLRAFLGMAVYWAADIFVLWACIAVFSGHQPSVETIIIGYATGYALTRRALPLAGAGAVESLLPFALSWTGIGLGVAVASVCAYRVFNLWLPLIPAAAGLFMLKRAGAEAALAGAAAAPARRSRYS